MSHRPVEIAIVDLHSILKDLRSAHVALTELTALSDLARIILDECDLTPRKAHFAEYLEKCSGPTFRTALSDKITEARRVLSEVILPAPDRLDPEAPTVCFSATDPIPLLAGLPAGTFPWDDLLTPAPPTETQSERPGAKVILYPKGGQPVERA